MQYLAEWGWNGAEYGKRKWRRGDFYSVDSDWTRHGNDPWAAGGFPFYLHDVGVLELGKQCYLQRDRAEMRVLYPAIHEDLGFSDEFYYSLTKLSFMEILIWVSLYYKAIILKLDKGGRIQADELNQRKSGEWQIGNEKKNE